MNHSQSTDVRCTGASRPCRHANYGIGCYHRKRHDHTNNCSACGDLNTGLRWCSHSKLYCKCEAAEENDG